MHGSMMGQPEQGRDIACVSYSFLHERRRVLQQSWPPMPRLTLKVRAAHTGAHTCLRSPPLPSPATHAQCALRVGGHEGQVDAAAVLPDDEARPRLTRGRVRPRIHQRLQPAGVGEGRREKQKECVRAYSNRWWWRCRLGWVSRQTTLSPRKGGWHSVRCNLRIPLPPQIASVATCSPQKPYYQPYSPPLQNTHYPPASSPLPVLHRDRLREGQVERDAPGHPKLVNPNVGVPRDDGTRRKVHALAHEVAADAPALALEPLADGLDGAAAALRGGGHAWRGVWVGGGRGER